MRRWRRLMILGVFLTACRPSAPGLVPATGIVTLDGTPVAHAVVVFLPLNETGNHRGGQGETDESGRFTLSTFHAGNDVSGIAPGDYRVGVTKLTVAQDMRTPPQNLLPEKYRFPKTSGLTATVHATEKNEIALDL